MTAAKGDLKISVFDGNSFIFFKIGYLDFSMFIYDMQKQLKRWQVSQNYDPELYTKKIAKTKLIFYLRVCNSITISNS